MTTPPRCRLIVNADDLGLQAERDTAILSLHRIGAISSATLVVNGPHAASAAKSACAQGLPLGLHLNLGDGPALTGRSSLTDHQGHLLGKAGLRAALDCGEIDGTALDAEIGAQLTRFHELTGRPPTHLDGHHHCHVAAAVAAALVRCLPGRWPRPAIRLPLLSAAIESPRALEERFSADALTLAFHHRVQREAAAAAPLFRRHGFRMPAGFFGIALMGCAMTPAALQASIDRLQQQGDGIYELMCHPGHPAPDGDAFAASAERQQEFDTLRSVFAGAERALPLTDFSVLDA